MANNNNNRSNNSNNNNRSNNSNNNSRSSNSNNNSRSSNNNNNNRSGNSNSSSSNNRTSNSAGNNANSSSGNRNANGNNNNSSGNNGNKIGIGAAVRQVGANLSAKEAMKIAKQSGASTAEVFAKAQAKGVGIGSGAINKFNAGKLGANFSTQVDGPYGISYNPRADAKTSKALGELGAIRNLRMQPNTSYMGYSSTGQGQYNPIVLPKDLLKGMTIGGQQGSGGPYDKMPFPTNTPGQGPGPWAAGLGSASTGTDAPPTGTNSPAEPVKPITQEQVDPIGMLSGGGAGINSATGLKRAKSSWKSKGMSSKGTSTLNRGLTITGYNV